MAITKNINKNSLFFEVKKSELEDRFDAPFYKEGFDFTDFIKLSKVAKIAGGKRLPEGYDFSDVVTRYRYLRVGDVSWDGTLNYNSFKYISKDVYKILKRYEIFNNELLIAIVGATVGKVSLLEIETDENVILTENCAKVSVKDESVLPKYLAIILQSKIVQKQIQLNYIQTTLPKLGLDRLASLYIPRIPSKDIQIKAVDLYYAAYSNKKQKDFQVKNLLLSIDSYIMKELGIALPAVNINQNKKTFITKFSDIVGGRFDPKLYDNTTKSLRLAILNSPLKKIKLKELIIHSVAGDWGKDENEGDLENYIRCIVIRATEFDNKANLNLDNSRVKYRLINIDKLKRIDIQENDLLIEKSGGSPDQPVGRIALITKDYIQDNQLCYSNFIHKIRVDSSKILPEYLFYFLKSIHNIKLTDAMQSQTNGIRNLIMSNYFNQEIIIPEVQMQIKMVNHIKMVLQQIKTLQSEAISILDNAKTQVEKMILG